MKEFSGLTVEIQRQRFVTLGFPWLISAGIEGWKFPTHPPNGVITIRSLFFKESNNAAVLNMIWTTYFSQLYLTHLNFFFNQRYSLYLLSRTQGISLSLYECDDCVTWEGKNAPGFQHTQNVVKCICPLSEELRNNAEESEAHYIKTQNFYIFILSTLNICEVTQLFEKHFSGHSYMKSRR